LHEQNVTLDLATMEGLNDEVRNLLVLLSSSLINEDDKASIGITINLKRPKDMSTLMEVSYKVKPIYPTRSRHILARSDLVGNLKVEATPAQKNLFPTEVVNNV